MRAEISDADIRLGLFKKPLARCALLFGQQPVTFDALVADKRYRFDLPGLCQRHGFKEFIKCSKSARHNNERKRILNEQCLADEEVPDRYPLIQVRIRLLFFRKDDVASN